MNRRQFLNKISYSSIPLLLGQIFLSCESKNNNTRPNILWIISEDTSPDFACYGNKLVKTPNVDRLASQGMLFTNAFATAPVCSPARSAFCTGMYQTSIGAHQHRTWQKKPLPPSVKVVTEYFRKAGYYTTNCAGLKFEKNGKKDWNFALDHDAFDGTDWKNRAYGQPFFAQMNLSLTHRVFVRDENNPINPENVKVPPIYPDHPITRRDWADYLESIQVLDSQIGKLLDRLDEEGLAENTIVFYFGDHGQAHLWAKQWLYDGGIRVPFIVRWPGHIQANSVNESLISLIDLVPTCLNLCGIQKPSYLQGKIFGSDQKEEREFIFAARDRCDETIDRIRCVRSKQFKYIRNFMSERPYTQFNAYKTQQYPVLQLIQVLHKKGELTEAQSRFMSSQKPEEELYDLHNDPDEIHNLVDDPKYQNILEEYCKQLDAWIEETGDKGEIPESQEEIKYWQQRMAQRNEQWMKSKDLPVDVSPEEHLKYWENRLFPEK